MDNNQNFETQQEQSKKKNEAPQGVPVNQGPVKIKKPFYKKWWFWAIIGILGIAIISGGSGNSDNNSGDISGDNSGSNISQPDDSSASSISWKKSGTYKVGVDIPAGEYFVKCSSYNCYIELSSDSTGSFDSIIANDNISTHTYITVRDGEYFKVTGGQFALSSTVDAVEPSSDGIYGEGTYKVGKDIPAGEYKIIATNNCYIEVSSNSNHTLSSIISNDNIEVGTSTYITVSDGQYLKVNGGKIQAP